jgi:DMSO/TMAO reductase YedYZ molybdopterin-dependent catalytic subunit
MKIILVRRIAFLAMALLPLSLPACGQQSAPPRTPTGPAEFKIGGAVATPMVVAAADLKMAPRKTIRVVNSHNNNKTEVYEGVPLAELLGKAGVAQGDQIRGPLMAEYVLVEAADGYRVIFSLAELDSSFLDSDVLVADMMDGSPIGGDEGPYKLVAPHDKRPGRWVRMVKSITLMKAP